MLFTIYLTWVETHKGLDKCLGLDSILACLLLLHFCLHILAPLPTIQLTSVGSLRLAPIKTVLYNNSDILK